MPIYAAAIVAVSRLSWQASALSIDAANEAEAIGKAYLYALKVWPIEDGWSSHQATVIPAITQLEQTKAPDNLSAQVQRFCASGMSKRILSKVIDSAVTSEREACAKIVDLSAENSLPARISGTAQDELRGIARDIRARK